MPLPPALLLLLGHARARKHHARRCFFLGFLLLFVLAHSWLAAAWMDTDGCADWDKLEAEGDVPEMDITKFPRMERGVR